MGMTAGILLIFISIAHNIYGEKIQIPALKKYTQDLILIGSQRIMVFQSGVLLLAVGIIQILVSIDLITLTGVARFFLVGIVSIDFFTALFIVIFFHKQILKITGPQFVLFIVIISLQLLSL
jgi:type IV secretory pathway TrbD component